MHYQTTDPITGNDINALEKAPFVVERRGDEALKIFFESEESREIYLDVEFAMFSHTIPRDIISDTLEP